MFDFICQAFRVSRVLDITEKLDMFTEAFKARKEHQLTASLDQTGMEKFSDGFLSFFPAPQNNPDRYDLSERLTAFARATVGF